MKRPSPKKEKGKDNAHEKNSKGENEDLEKKAKQKDFDAM